MNGWVKLHRKILDSPMWNWSDSRVRVWITILLLANHKESKWTYNNEEVLIPRGSFITTQRNLATLSRTSRQTVRCVLRLCLKNTAIRTQIRTQSYTQIDVVNWDTYQGEELDENPVKNQKRTQLEPSENPSGRMKEGKNERKEQIHCEDGASRNGYHEIAVKVLTSLNDKAHRSYRTSDTNIDLIVARLKDGIEEWQLRAIVARKCREWDTDDMRKYLRPATLFNKTKCEQYLGELPREDQHGMS